MARIRVHQQPPPQPRFVFGQSFLWCSSTGACGQPHVGYALTPAMAPGVDRAEMICYRWDISGSMGMDCPCLGDLVLPSSCCVGVVVRRWRRRRWRNDDNDDDDNVGNGATGNGIQRRWRWHDGRWDTTTMVTTMAADDDSAHALRWCSSEFISQTKSTTRVR